MTDPRDLAETLVRDAPGGAGGSPAMLELEGLRWLASEGAGDDVVTAFTDRLAELTGYTAPSRTTHAPMADPASPGPDPTDAALEQVAQAFSAPFDGTDARLATLADRARSLAAPYLAQGADADRIETRIKLEASELRNKWNARSF